MSEKVYDLEERTFVFAKNVRSLVKSFVQNIANKEDSKQVVRSSGSIGANYIEANEALSKKDFQMRIKISRKEAKETVYWLRLLQANNDNEIINLQLDKLINEATELKKIFSSILTK